MKLKNRMRSVQAVGNRHTGNGGDSLSGTFTNQFGDELTARLMFNATARGPQPWISSLTGYKVGIPFEVNREFGAILIRVQIVDSIV